MKRFLKKVGLVKNYSIIIPLQKSDCIKLFRENIDAGNVNSLLPIKEYVSSSRNKYVGEVNFNDFQLRRKKKIIDFNKNTSIVKGIFRAKENVLFLNTEIIGMNLFKTSLYIYIVALFIYFVVYSLMKKQGLDITIFPTVLIQISILYGVPYLVLKSRIKRMQSELEQEIDKWIMKNFF